MKRFIIILGILISLTTPSYALKNDELLKLVDKSNSGQEKVLTGDIERQKQEMQLRLRIMEEKKKQEEEEKVKRKRILESSTPYSEYDFLRGARDLKLIQDIIKDSNPSEDVRKLINSTIKYIGKPYVWGGDDSRTLSHSYDCSGFTKSIYSRLGFDLPRTAQGQTNVVKRIHPSKARMGDLIFFKNTYPTTGASHVGIYLKDGYMVHASSGKGYITVDTIMNNYWINHFLGFGRLIEEGDK